MREHKLSGGERIVTFGTGIGEAGLGTILALGFLSNAAEFGGTALYEGLVKTGWATQGTLVDFLTAHHDGEIGTMSPVLQAGLFTLLSLGSLTFIGTLSRPMFRDGVKRVSRGYSGYYK